MLSLTELPVELREHFYVGGEWVPCRSGTRAPIVSPVTESELITVPLAGDAEMDGAIAAARSAFDEGTWPDMAPGERAQYLTRMSDAVRTRLPLFAKLWTAQVGAPIALAEQLVQTGQTRYDYFAQLAGSYQFEDRRQTVRGHARVRREPVGVAALIAPWNAVFALFGHKVPSSLAAGCTVILKSPIESPFEALLLAECAQEAGIPPGVFNVVTADADQASRLVASPMVDKISFTGSVGVGRVIGQAAAARSARLTLELGGKSAAVLLDDADLSTVLPALVPFTMPFSGQICVSQTRILAPNSRLAEVAEAYAAAVSGLKVGDPWDAETRIGPVLNTRQYERVLGYMNSARSEGATLVCGGGRASGFDRGHFIAPTVFTDVKPDMTIAREEVFGPVVTLHGYDDIDDAVRLANATDYGLSGSVFGADAEQACDVAGRIRTGHVAVNGFELSPVAPFGGRKSSGLGREGGPEGLEEYLETKSIFMPGPA